MASNLQCNTSPVSALIHSHLLEASVYKYPGWTTVKNYFLERRDHVPERDADWGGSSVFKMPNISDLLGDIQLMFTVSGLTVNIGGGALPAYQDYLGLVAWETIEWRYGTNVLYTITPEELWDDIVTLYSIESRDAILECVAGKISFADRQDNADGKDQELIVDLNFPWCRGLSRFLGSLQLAQEPRITVKWRRPEDVVQNAGVALTVLPILSDVKLRTSNVYVDADERDSMTYELEHKDGRVCLFMQHVYEKVRITGPVTGEHKIKLNNFRSDASEFQFFVRRVTGVDTPWLKDELGDLLPIHSWSLGSMNETFVHKMGDKYNRFHLHRKYHAGPAGEYRYFHAFAIDPNEKMNATGGLDLGCKTNLTLTIDFANIYPALAVPYNGDIEIVVSTKEYNTEQRVRGDHVTNFH